MFQIGKGAAVFVAIFLAAVAANAQPTVLANVGGYNVQLLGGNLYVVSVIPKSDCWEQNSVIILCEEVLAYNLGAKALTTVYSANGTGYAGSELTGQFAMVGKALYFTDGWGGSGYCTYFLGAQTDVGCGQIFKVNARGAVKQLYSFEGSPDGKFPYGGVYALGNKLWGTTQYGGKNGFGALFIVNMKTDEEKIVHSFTGGADGANPNGVPVALGNSLYGTTEGGGAYGNGTIYAYDLNTKKETVVYSFCSSQNCPDGFSPQGNLIVASGELFGMSSAALFAFNPANAKLTVAMPLTRLDLEYLEGFVWFNGVSGLVAANGMIYGIRSGIGAYCDNLPPTGVGCGALFAYDPSTGQASTFYTFCSQTSCTDGASPSELAASSEYLFGATYGGGPNSTGELYEFCIDFVLCHHAK